MGNVGDKGPEPCRHRVFLLMRHMRREEGSLAQTRTYDERALRPVADCSGQVVWLVARPFADGVRLCVEDGEGNNVDL